MECAIVVFWTVERLASNLEAGGNIKKHASWCELFCLECGDIVERLDRATGLSIADRYIYLAIFYGIVVVTTSNHGENFTCFRIGNHSGTIADIISPEFIDLSGE